ncbi:amidohydrolase 2 [Cucurbitaria berberidis CBS 394.84]|uniref:6-methylsalicylate decarboxylase n=1 Tax=Cucurbitaria berberidis CBS 394.84 TaxID=1168544 RepID=A0A9P4GWD4_9PLEO|nr:amidohydrolase 2 [Cucurbitaria berberidis CBS 394.84]KAF1852236.1 amidohydrolase 2 [Cucurbitaria berberidis CBS 394.84]
MRIDTHHHILPLIWLDVFNNITKGIQLPPGLAMPAWSVNSSLSVMEQNGIGAAIVSLSAPAFSIIPDPQLAAKIARGVNQYSATLHDMHPSQFGFFASVPPLTDTAAALAEIKYAFDELSADGVVLFTSYDEIYLGSPRFQSIWAELDKRAAVVFIHPIQNMNQTTVNAFLNPSVIDFPHETTRTAADLITSGTLRRYPNVRIILSHGGGTLPYIATRAANLLGDIGLTNQSATEFLQQAHQFYYDLALTSYEFPLELLLRFADPERILYGSDYPFISTRSIEEQVAIFDRLELNHTVRRDITHQNAQKLFPRFGSVKKPTSAMSLFKVDVNS